jgi:ribosomal protein S18 acetylase RimI-like enzyme
VPVSETFVRLALPRDIDAVAAIQARAWEDAYGELLPTVVRARLEPNARVEWTAALERPPTSAHHLLVATDGPEVVGFAAVEPADEGDGGPGGVGSLTVLAIDPAHRAAGHGSRLLSAVAETLRIDGFSTAVCWLPETDEAQQRFLVDAGWGPDGARRELDMGTAALHEVRLHTAL